MLKKMTNLETLMVLHLKLVIFSQLPQVEDYNTHLNKLEKSNKLYCEMCGVEPKINLEEFGLRMFECHHIIPISETIREKTKLSDLSFLCANCHRLIHAAISQEKRWLNIVETAELLGIKKSPNQRHKHDAQKARAS